MTKLTKQVRRETDRLIRDGGEGPVVVEIEPPGVVYFRRKGRRTRYGLPAETLFMTCLNAHVRSIEREKRAAKKARRRR